MEIPLAQFAKIVGGNIGQIVKKVKMDIFLGVIRDTRVDTGRLRGNWQFSSGAEAAGESGRIDKTPQGSDGGAAQADVSSGVKADTVDYLTNNLPYAAVWEERDGMIARNVARIERDIKERIAQG